jgi:hypothetical protein
MKRVLTVAVAGAILASAATAPAIAHHSAAMFDMDKTISVAGTVKDFQYTNPHSWLIVVAPGPGGTEVEWSFEAEGPSTLLRNGIKKSSLPAGEKVTVRTHPMKDGRPAGAWIDLTKGDGTVLDPHGAPPPGAPGAPGAGATAPSK